jgi:hypothetical protein
MSGAAQGLPLGGEDFGYPNCRECGYPWSTSFEEARSVLASAPQRFEALLQDGTDLKRKPDPKIWSPSGYVWHLSDWLRIQAQRIYGITHDPAYEHVGIDQDELDGLFHYDRLSTPAGLWALERSAGDFQTATEGIDPNQTFDHPTAGTISLHDIVRYVAHEVVHHDLDVRRGLGLSNQPFSISG